MKTKTSLLLVISWLMVSSSVFAFDQDILILKWHRSDQVVGYLVKVEMTRSDGDKVVYQYTLGDVISTRIDVEQEADHLIELFPISAAGVQGDALMQLNFIPYGLKF